MSEQNKLIVTSKELLVLKKTCGLIIESAFLMDGLLEELQPKEKNKVA